MSSSPEPSAFEDPSPQETATGPASDSAEPAAEGDEPTGLPDRPTSPFLERGGDWLRAHTKLWVTGVAVVVLAVAGLVVWPMFDTGDDEAEARVRQYLEAVRDKDLDKAESMLENPVSDGDQLLTAAALDTDWTIQSLESVDFQRGSSFAKVDTVLKAGNGDEASFQFELTRLHYDGEEPLCIRNGYVDVQVVEDRHEHLLINGEPLVEEGEHRLGETLWLYPGVYRFGHALEDLIDVDWQRRLLPGGSYMVEGSGQDLDESDPSAESWELTTEGEEQAQELLEAHIDECAETTQPIELGCPFGAHRVSAGESRTVYGEDLDDVEWEVEGYPDATVHWEEGALRFTDLSPGLMRLTATGDTVDGPVDVEVECQMDTTNLRLTVGGDGEPAVEALANHTSDPALWSTC